MIIQKSSLRNKTRCWEHCRRPCSYSINHHSNYSWILNSLPPITGCYKLMSSHRGGVGSGKLMGHCMFKNNYMKNLLLNCDNPVVLMHLLMTRLRVSDQHWSLSSLNYWLTKIIYSICHQMRILPWFCDSSLPSWTDISWILTYRHLLCWFMWTEIHSIIDDQYLVGQDKIYLEKEKRTHKANDT